MREICAASTSLSRPELSESSSKTWSKRPEIAPDAVDISGIRWSLPVGFHFHLEKKKKKKKSMPTRI